MARRRGGMTGEKLNEKWDIGAQQARYRETGDWFMPLERFPGALCDAHGFVRFETRQEYESCAYLQIGPRKVGSRSRVGADQLPLVPWARTRFLIACAFYIEHGHPLLVEER